MNILVCYASKHHATHGIAETIGEELRLEGHHVDVLPIKGTINLTRYDAIIFGSAVYMGKWLPEAMTFARDQQSILATKSLWLFSSGPVGEKSPPSTFELAEVNAFAQEIGAHEHRVFQGRLELDDLGVVQRMIVQAIHAPTGDFRDWDAIRAWARAIDRQLMVHS
jgi:menaquinone-dependent protoporphyrinogen oxidase